MPIAHWVNGHGVEVIVVYFFFSALVQSLPPLPSHAGFWAQWGYSFLRIASADLKQAVQQMQAAQAKAAAAPVIKDGQ